MRIGREPDLRTNAVTPPPTNPVSSPHETSWECADRGLRPPWLLGSEDRRIPLWVGTWVGSSVSRVWAYGSPGHNARYWESRRGSLDLTPPRTTSLCREYRGQTRGSGSECGSPNATGRHQSAASFYKVVAATESWADRVGEISVRDLSRPKQRLYFTGSYLVLTCPQFRSVLKTVEPRRVRVLRCVTHQQRRRASSFPETARGRRNGAETALESLKRGYLLYTCNRTEGKQDWAAGGLNLLGRHNVFMGWRVPRALVRQRCLFDAGGPP